MERPERPEGLATPKKPTKTRAEVIAGARKTARASGQKPSAAIQEAFAAQRAEAAEEKYKAEEKRWKEQEKEKKAFIAETERRRQAADEMADSQGDVMGYYRDESGAVRPITARKKVGARMTPKGPRVLYQESDQSITEHDPMETGDYETDGNTGHRFVRDETGQKHVLDRNLAYDDFKKWQRGEEQLRSSKSDKSAKKTATREALEIAKRKKKRLEDQKAADVRNRRISAGSTQKDSEIEALDKQISKLEKAYEDASVDALKAREAHSAHMKNRRSAEDARTNPRYASGGLSTDAPGTRNVKEKWGIGGSDWFMESREGQRKQMPILPARPEWLGPGVSNQFLQRALQRNPVKHRPEVFARDELASLRIGEVMDVPAEWLSSKEGKRRVKMLEIDSGWFGKVRVPIEQEWKDGGWKIAPKENGLTPIEEDRPAPEGPMKWEDVKHANPADKWRQDRAVAQISKKLEAYGTPEEMRRRTAMEAYAAIQTAGAAAARDTSQYREYIEHYDRIINEPESFKDLWPNKTKKEAYAHIVRQREYFKEQVARLDRVAKSDLYKQLGPILGDPTGVPLEDQFEAITQHAPAIAAAKNPERVNTSFLALKERLKQGQQGTTANYNADAEVDGVRKGMAKIAFGRESMDIRRRIYERFRQVPEYTQHGEKLTGFDEIAQAMSEDLERLYSSESIQKAFHLGNEKELETALLTSHHDEIKESIREMFHASRKYKEFAETLWSKHDQTELYGESAKFDMRRVPGAEVAETGKKPKGVFQFRLPNGEVVTTSDLSYNPDEEEIINYLAKNHTRTFWDNAVGAVSFGTLDSDKVDAFEGDMGYIKDAMNRFNKKRLDTHRTTGAGLITGIDAALDWISGDDMDFNMAGLMAMDFSNEFTDEDLVGGSVGSAMTDYLDEYRDYIDMRNPTRTSSNLAGLYSGAEKVGTAVWSELGQLPQQMLMAGGGKAILAGSNLAMMGQYAYDDAYRHGKAAGLSDTEANSLALKNYLVTGVPNAALETVADWVMFKAGKPFGDMIPKALKSQTRRAHATLAARITGGGLTEGSTEYSQTVWENIAADSILEFDDRQWTEGAGFAAIVGGIIGSLASTPGSYWNWKREKKLAGKIGEVQDALEKFDAAMRTDAGRAAYEAENGPVSDPQMADTQRHMRNSFDEMAYEYVGGEQVIEGLVRDLDLPANQEQSLREVLADPKNGAVLSSTIGIGKQVASVMEAMGVGPRLVEAVMNSMSDSGRSPSMEEGVDLLSYAAMGQAALTHMVDMVGKPNDPNDQLVNFGITSGLLTIDDNGDTQPMPQILEVLPPSMQSQVESVINSQDPTHPVTGVAPNADFPNIGRSTIAEAARGTVEREDPPTWIVRFKDKDGNEDIIDITHDDPAKAQMLAAVELKKELGHEVEILGVSPANESATEAQAEAESRADLREEARDFFHQKMIQLGEVYDEFMRNFGVNVNIAARPLSFSGRAETRTKNKAPFTDGRMTRSKVAMNNKQWIAHNVTISQFSVIEKLADLDPASWDEYLSSLFEHEMLHVAVNHAMWEMWDGKGQYKAHTRRLLEQVADEMSAEERQMVIEAYGSQSEVSKRALGAEFLRMVLQQRLNGTPTEVFKTNGMVAKLLAWLEQFAADLFNLENRETTRQVVEDSEALWGAVQREVEGDPLARPRKELETLHGELFVDRMDELSLREDGDAQRIEQLSKQLDDLEKRISEVKEVEASIAGAEDLLQDADEDESKTLRRELAGDRARLAKLTGEPVGDPLEQGVEEAEGPEMDIWQQEQEAIRRNKESGVDVDVFNTSYEQFEAEVMSMTDGDIRDAIKAINDTIEEASKRGLLNTDVALEANRRTGILADEFRNPDRHVSEELPDADNEIAFEDNSGWLLGTKHEAMRRRVNQLADRALSDLREGIGVSLKTSMTRPTDVNGLLEAAVALDNPNWWETPQIAAEITDALADEVRSSPTRQNDTRTKNWAKVYKNSKGSYKAAAQQQLQESLGENWETDMEDSVEVDYEPSDTDPNQPGRDPSEVTPEGIDISDILESIRKTADEVASSESVADELRGANIDKTRRAAASWWAPALQGVYTMLNTVSKLRGGSGRVGSILRSRQYDMSMVKAVINKAANEMAQEMREIVKKSSPWIDRVTPWKSFNKRVEKFMLHMHLVAARLNPVSNTANSDRPFAFEGFNMKVGAISKEDLDDIAPGWTQGSVVRLDGKDLIVGETLPNPNSDAPAFQLYQHMTAEQQDALYDHMRDTWGDLVQFLDMFIDPSRADARMKAGGQEIPVFNRASYEDYMKNSPFGDAELHQGWTPDVVNSKLVNGGIHMMMADRFRTGLGMDSAVPAHGKKGGLFTSPRARVRSNETGAVRELGLAANFLDGMKVRMMEGYQEQARRELAWDLLKNGVVDIPEGGVIPNDYVKFDKATINRLVKQLMIHMGQRFNKHGERIPTFWDDRRRQGEEDGEYFSRRLDGLTAPDREIIERVFGDPKEVFKLLNSNKMVHKQVWHQIMSQHIDTQFDHALLKFTETMVQQGTAAFLVKPATIAFNWASPNIQASIQSAWKGFRAGINLSLSAGNAAVGRTDQSKQYLEDAEVDARAAFHSFLGLFTNRVAFKRKEARLNRFVPREVFDDANMYTAVLGEKETSGWQELKRLRVPTAILTAVNVADFDKVPKQIMMVAAYRAQAAIAFRKAKKEDPSLDRKKFMDDWMDNVTRDNREVHERAYEVANSFGLDFSNVPVWMRPEGITKDTNLNRGIRIGSKLIFTFPNFIHTYASFIFSKVLPLRPGYELLKGGETQAGDSKRVNALSSLATFSVLTWVIMRLRGDNEEPDENPPLIGDEYDLFGQLMEFWSASGASISLDAIQERFGIKTRDLVELIMEVGGANGGDEGREYWLSHTSLPFIADLAALGTFYNWIQQYGPENPVLTNMGHKDPEWNWDRMAAEMKDRLTSNVGASGIGLTILGLPNKFNERFPYEHRAAEALFQLGVGRIAPQPLMKMATDWFDPVRRRSKSSTDKLFDSGWKKRGLDYEYTWQDHIKSWIPGISKRTPPTGRTIQNVEIDSMGIPIDPDHRRAYWYLITPKEDGGLGFPAESVSRIYSDDTVAGEGTRKMVYIDPETITVESRGEWFLRHFARISVKDQASRLLAEAGIEDHNELKHIQEKIISQGELLEANGYVPPIDEETKEEYWLTEKEAIQWEAYIRAMRGEDFLLFVDQRIRRDQEYFENLDKVAREKIGSPVLNGEYFLDMPIDPQRERYALFKQDVNDKEMGRVSYGKRAEDIFRNPNSDLYPEWKKLEAEMWAKQPRNAAGDAIDPYTGEVLGIRGEHIAFGHGPGYEARIWKHIRDHDGLSEYEIAKAQLRFFRANLDSVHWQNQESSNAGGKFEGSMRPGEAGRKRGLSGLGHPERKKLDKEDLHVTKDMRLLRPIRERLPEVQEMLDKEEEEKIKRQSVVAEDAEKKHNSKQN